MSDLETKIKITVENGTAAGFNQAANSAQSASRQIEAAISQVKSQLVRSFSEMQQSMEKAFDVDMADFNSGIGAGKEKVKELNAELAKTENVAEQAAGGLGKIGTLLVGFASVSFAKSMLDTADAMQSINSQVRQVTSSETEYLAVQRQLLDVANSTRASLESTSSESQIIPASFAETITFLSPASIIILAFLRDSALVLRTNSASEGDMFPTFCPSIFIF